MYFSSTVKPNKEASVFRFSVNFNDVEWVNTAFYISVENYVMADFIGLGIFLSLPAY